MPVNTERSGIISPSIPNFASSAITVPKKKTQLQMKFHAEWL